MRYCQFPLTRGNLFCFKYLYSKCKKLNYTYSFFKCVCPDNPYLITNEEIYYNIFSNFYTIVDIPFVKGLSYRLNYSPNFRTDHNYNFTKQDIYRTDNHTSASKFNRQDFDWVQENILTY